MSSAVSASPPVQTWLKHEHVDLSNIPRFSSEPITSIPLYVYGNCNQATCQDVTNASLPILLSMAQNPKTEEILFPIIDFFTPEQKEANKKKAEFYDWIRTLERLKKDYLQNKERHPDTPLTVEEIIRINGSFEQMNNPDAGKLRDKMIRWPLDTCDATTSMMVSLMEGYICEKHGEKTLRAISTDLKGSMKKSIFIDSKYFHGTIREFRAHPERCDFGEGTDLSVTQLDDQIVEKWTEDVIRGISKRPRKKINATKFLSLHIHIFPPPSEIKSELQKTLDFANDVSHHPIARACYLWYRIIEIHISHHANKRTGKGWAIPILLQNGFLPPIIGNKPGDAEEYQGVLKECFRCPNETYPEPGYVYFTDYVARKILATQEEMKGLLLI